MAKAAVKKAPKASVKKELTVKEKEKQQALSEYEQHMDAVRNTKAMTDTTAWQQFYRGIQQEIEKHGRMVLVTEQTRTIIRHQEGVKILRALVEKIAEPVHELNRFISNMPLFAPDMGVRAEWNTALGKVELKAIDSSK